MKMSKFGFPGLFFLSAFFLVGCGFQLKGTAGAVNSPSLAGTEVVLISGQPRGELTTALRQQLRLQGAVLSEETTEGLVLRLGAERFQQRNLSLTAQARAAEVELTMMASLNLSQGAIELVRDTDAQVVRQFLNDPLNVVGKTEELRLLREEMREDLAAQIIRRITHRLGN
ncbi:MAG: LPS assembly lipoprotein LptE [Luminiphilus sp.]|nr:LPS assembly lipoprotein LptE [Luminiphilus sp.]